MSAQFQEQITKPGSAWIFDLIQAELRPELSTWPQEGDLDFKARLILESATSFLAQCKDLITQWGKYFNSYSQNEASYQELKIYALAQSPTDFMVFRNHIKMIFSLGESSQIRITFAKHSALPTRQENTYTKNYEILAKLTPLRKIHWLLDDEEVSPQDLSRFFFEEFLKMTRTPPKTQDREGFLLEQVKNLLDKRK